ncbi:GNAT family N-acetyltransferase [Streptomyces sp. SID3343]|nr:GNAT family N-acetyltransferase [Streptomyces sp. SID3343]
MAWLTARGQVGQWGSEPWSARPEAVERVEKRLREQTTRIAEVDGSAAGCCVVSDTPADYVDAAAEPELYVALLVVDRRFSGLGVGATLIADACEEARRRGVRLVRVDCYAGNGGGLVEQYVALGFTPLTTFTVERDGRQPWPGRVLGMRLD